MKYKKTFFILILVVFLFSISVASASDENNTILNARQTPSIDDIDNEILQTDSNTNLEMKTQASNASNQLLKEDNSLDKTPISSNQKTPVSSDKKSTDDTSVALKVAIPKIIAEKKTYITNKPIKYRITLKDSLNNTIDNEKVSLKCDGKVYSAITNKKGIATFKITNLNKNGKFKASLTFNGNEYYKKLTMKGTIVVKDIHKTTFPTLSKNSKNKAAVKKVQRALKNKGYYITYKGHYLKVDGWYGPCTFKAVKQFQKAKKLKVTGKVDAKTASKLNIFKNKSKKKVSIKFINVKPRDAVIYFENDDAFERDYNSGKSFNAQICDKKTGKGIETIFWTDYFQNGKKVNKYDICYYTGEDGTNSITPDDLEVGIYTLKVYSKDPAVKVTPKYKKIIITKTSINIKIKTATLYNKNMLKLAISLEFKNNYDVDEGKVKITAGGNSYIVDVHNGKINKNITLDNTASNKITVTYLGNKNIKPKTVTKEWY